MPCDWSLWSCKKMVPWHYWLADGTTRVQSPKALATILSCDVKDSRKYVNFALLMSSSKIIELQFSEIFTVNMLLAKTTTTKLIVRIHGQFWMAIENYVFAARWYNYINQQWLMGTCWHTKPRPFAVNTKKEFKPVRKYPKYRICSVFYVQVIADLLAK